MTYKCPYCSRKINYTTRFLEHGNGEHVCSHCQKPSNIAQNRKIWSLLIICSLIAGLIMLFYLIFGNMIEDINDENGTLKLLMALFFGKGKEIKWIIWEMIPFAVFWFVSPKYMEFIPLRKYMEQTATKIDLTVPTPPRTTENGNRSDTKNTRIIPKEDQVEFTGEYEDISSSSESPLEKTRSFSVNDAVNVTPSSSSTSASYTSDIPLKRVNPEIDRDREYFESIVRDVQRNIEAQEKAEERPATGNFSGNRKF